MLYGVACRRSLQVLVYHQLKEVGFSIFPASGYVAGANPCCSTDKAAVREGGDPGPLQIR